MQNTNKLSLLKRDITINAISRCGKFRVTAVSAPNILKETVRRHHLSSASPETKKFKWDPTIAIPLLGQVICFSNLTASWLHHEERVKTSFATVQNGTFIAQSLALGETISYVANRPVKVNSEEEQEHPNAYEYDEDLIFSNGVLKTERIMYRNTTPVLSATKWVPSADEQQTLFQNKLNDDNINNNLVPHAQNFFARSDGVPTAAFFFCHYDENNLDQVYNGGVFLQPVAVSAAEVEDESKNDFDANGNVVVDPATGKAATTKSLKAASQELEDFVLRRCDIFAKLATTIDHEKQVVNFSNQTDGNNIDAVFLAQLHRRAKQGLLLQDLLGIATNDWSGAAKVCAKARHLTQKDLESDTSVEWASDIVTTPELATLAEKSFDSSSSSQSSNNQNENDKTTNNNLIKRIRLDPESTKRTAIDFFCRCQKSSNFQNFLKSMKTSETALKFVRENLEFEEASKNYKYSCASCGVESGLSEEEVVKLFS